MEQEFMKYKICTPRDARFIQLLVTEYVNSNISLRELSQKYHTDAYYQFKIHNIPKRSKGEQRVLTRKGCIEFGWNCKTIETEEHAYIAGLFLADGYVSKTQAGIRLKDTDKLLIQKIKNYFSEKVKLQKDGKCYSFVLSSKQLCQNLQNLGIFKGKTNRELHIPKMDNVLLRHFVRGFFDGDGSVFLNHNGRYTYLRCNICSPTFQILEQINSVLQSNDICGTINKENRKDKYTKFNQKIVKCKSDMYRLFIRDKKSLNQFYHFLYDNSSLYLERKKKIFEDNIQLLNNRNSAYANTELTNQIAKG